MSKSKPARKKGKYITVCPECNSTKVFADMSDPLMAATGLFHSFRKCSSCGYRGVLFPEMLKKKK